MKLKMDVTEIVSQIRAGDKMGVAVYLNQGGDANARNNLNWTLLHLACLEGKAEIAEVLLDAGAHVNSCTTDMCTPLHRASTQGNIRTVEILLKKGAYINAQDKNGNTPLHEAAKALHTSIAKLLIEKKADKTRLNKKNQLFTNMIGQQMMSVVESGDIDVLVQWLDWGMSLDTVGNFNWSILHHSCARGQINIASVLLERGANVNCVDSNKGTPLHTASFHGHKRIVDLLIGTGANINAQDQLGNTPLHSAIAGEHPDIINSLLDSGCDTTIANAEGQIFTHLVNEFLVEAVENKRVAYVCSLLRGRANPNTKDARGYPVLCCAAFQEDLLTVDALLQAGADPNVYSEANQKTPLHYAASWGHLFILKSLLDKGASVSATDHLKRTPLHEAAQQGAEDVVTVLIGRLAPLNAQDIDGNTPLHMAAKWGQSEIVDLLIEREANADISNNDGHLYMDLALMRAVRTEDCAQVLSCLAWGGDPNVKDNKGWSLLHHAVYKEAIEVVRLLIESESEVNVSDKEGRTPLLLAAYRGNLEITKELIDAGANLDAQDNRGRTPLHWASAEGSADTVELLLLRGAKRNLKNKEGQLYTDLLVKHLYLAVRHNDSQKVERLLKAGANQTVQVFGTGTTPRDEAKRRKHYPLLREMIAAAPKKASPTRDDTGVIEDISRLFEDETEKKNEDSKSGEDSSEEESEEEDQDEEYDPDEDAYWRMHNAPMVLSAKEIFEEENKDFWEHWEERPKVISVKELFKEDEEDLWSYWKEFESSDESSIEEDSEAKQNISFQIDKIKHSWDNVIPAKEFFREDECWWRDAVEELDSPEIISAKEFFKDENKPWWDENSDEESDRGEEEYIAGKENIVQENEEKHSSQDDDDDYDADNDDLDESETSESLRQDNLVKESKISDQTNHAKTSLKVNWGGNLGLNKPSLITKPILKQSYSPPLSHRHRKRSPKLYLSNSESESSIGYSSSDNETIEVKREKSQFSSTDPSVKSTEPQKEPLELLHESVKKQKQKEKVIFDIYDSFSEEKPSKSTSIYGDELSTKDLNDETKEFAFKHNTQVESEVEVIECPLKESFEKEIELEVINQNDSATEDDEKSLSESGSFQGGSESSLSRNEDEISLEYGSNHENLRVEEAQVVEGKEEEEDKEVVKEKGEEGAEVVGEKEKEIGELEVKFEIEEVEEEASDNLVLKENGQGKGRMLKGEKYSLDMAENYLDEELPENKTLSKKNLDTLEVLFVSDNDVKEDLTEEKDVQISSHANGKGKSSQVSIEDIHTDSLSRNETIVASNSDRDSPKEILQDAKNALAYDQLISSCQDSSKTRDILESCEREFSAKLSQKEFILENEATLQANLAFHSDDTVNLKANELLKSSPIKHGELLIPKETVVIEEDKNSCSATKSGVETDNLLSGEEIRSPPFADDATESKYNDLNNVDKLAIEETIIENTELNPTDIISQPDCILQDSNVKKGSDTTRKEIKFEQTIESPISDNTQWVNNPIFSKLQSGSLSLNNNEVGSSNNDNSEKHLDSNLLKNNSKLESTLKSAKNFFTEIDECLARVDAKLAWVDARLANDGSKNSQLTEKENKEINEVKSNDGNFPERQTSVPTPQRENAILSNDRIKNSHLGGKENIEICDIESNSDQSEPIISVSTPQKVELPEATPKQTINPKPRLNIFKLNVNIPKNLPSPPIKQRNPSKKKLSTCLKNSREKKENLQNTTAGFKNAAKMNNSRSNDSLNITSSEESLLLSSELASSSRELDLSLSLGNREEPDHQDGTDSFKKCKDKRHGNSSFSSANQASEGDDAFIRDSNESSECFLNDASTPTLSCSPQFSTISPHIDESYINWSTYNPRSLEEYDRLAVESTFDLNSSLVKVEKQHVSCSPIPSSDGSADSCVDPLDREGVSTSVDAHIPHAYRTNSRKSLRCRNIPRPSHRPRRRHATSVVHDCPLYHPLTECSRNNQHIFCNTGSPSRDIAMEDSQTQTGSDFSSTQEVSKAFPLKSVPLNDSDNKQGIKVSLRYLMFIVVFIAFQSAAFIYIMLSPLIN